MSQSITFEWPQGEDLKISLVYKEGDTPQRAVPVNLSAGYEARLTIFLPGPSTVLHTIQSPSANVMLSAGLNRTPNLTIYLPRALTLTGGALKTQLDSNVTSFDYDIFLRNTTTDRQVKILRGRLKVERSGTQWV